MKCEITGLAFDSVEYGDAVERAENILLGSTASDEAAEVLRGRRNIKRGKV